MDHAPAAAGYCGSRALERPVTVDRRLESGRLRWIAGRERPAYSESRAPERPAIVDRGSRPVRYFETRALGRPPIADLRQEIGPQPCIVALGTAGCCGSRALERPLLWIAGLAAACFVAREPA